MSIFCRASGFGGQPARLVALCFDSGARGNFPVEFSFEHVGQFA